MEIEQQHRVNQDDLLWQQLKTIPAFRAFLRAVEARFYYSIDLSGNLLDVGCGDGNFSELIFDEPVTAGIDPWWNPLKKSQKAGMYKVLAQAMGDRMPFNDATFDHAFSNSVLEHIPDIQPVLNDVSRVLKENGRFVITTPSHYFTEYLGGAGFFERIGMDSMAEQYRKFFNGISRHAHTDPPEVWTERLAQAGFEIERWQYYFSKSALHALEIGHAQGMPAAISHVLTGHWILAPWKSSLKPTEEWLRPFYNEPFGDEGAYMLIIARKKSNSPIATYLPQARPFSIAELEANLPTAAPISVQTEKTSIAAVAPTVAEEVAPIVETDVITKTVQEATEPKKKRNDLLSIILVALSLFCVIIGQSALSSQANDPIQSAVGEPTAGLSWFVAAFVMLFLVGWRTNIVPHPHIQLPKLRAIPKQRAFYFVGLLLSLVAFRLTSTPNSENPVIAILLWVIAIVIGYYSLAGGTKTSQEVSETTSVQPEDHPAELNQEQEINPEEADRGSIFSRSTILIAFVLLIVSLLVRYLSLSHLPGMLNGIESSLGLDAARINAGVIRNPFGTSWLTNPTLLLYFIAIPIKLLGQTITAVRFLSPLIGTVTVLAVFILGKRIWGQAIALLAAILLTGSYLHIHYSRMGMTNIWDPLLVLLVLGLIAVAWERPSSAENQRVIWLWAGAFLGLSTFAFTSSRLLPVMLILIFLLWLIFDRQTLREQFGHLLSFLSIAFLVALPILLFYQNHPDILWERYNMLGVFDGQTGWLSQEAARFGVSSWEMFTQQFWNGMFAFNGVLDRSPAFRPLTGLLSFATAVLTLIGFFITLIRIRQFKYNLLLVWVLVTLFFSGVVLIESPQSHRLVIAVPALTLLASIGLVAIGQFVLQAFQSDGNDVVQLDDPTTDILSLQRPFTPATKLFTVLALFAILFGLSEVAYYYGRFPVDNKFGDRNTEIADKISRYINEADEPATVYLYGPPYLYTDFPTFTYLLADYQIGNNLHNVDESGTIPPAANSQLLFFYLPERFGEIDSTRAIYPNGRTTAINGQYGEPLFQVYEVTQ